MKGIMKEFLIVGGSVLACTAFAGIMAGACISLDVVSMDTIAKFDRSSYKLRDSLTGELKLDEQIKYVDLIKGQRVYNKNILTLNVTNDLNDENQFIVKYSLSDEDYEKIARFFGNENSFLLKMSAPHKSTTTEANKFEENNLNSLCDTINSVVYTYDPVYVSADGTVVVDYFSNANPDL